MKLPAAFAKVGKKHLIASSLLLAVGVGAFVAGQLRHKPEAEATEEAHSAAHNEKHSDEHERKPAAVPAKDDSSDDDSAYEEEVEVQIAHAEKVKPDTRGTFTKVVDTYADAIQTVNEKVQTLQRVEEDNRKLKMENAYLRVMVESKDFTCRSEDAKKKTETVGKKLVTAAGSKAARSLASIGYQFPENLLPEQLHALGVSYFKARDDEKAAVILHFLTEMEEDKTYKTAANYLMAGISFYRLENYKGAAQYFEKVTASTEKDEESDKAKRQANYWQALVAERLKDPKKAQKLILESLEQNPQTKEALWVNPKGITPPKKAGRIPANEPVSQEHTEEQSEEHHDGHSKHH